MILAEAHLLVILLTHVKGMKMLGLTWAAEVIVLNLILLNHSFQFYIFIID